MNPKANPFNNQRRWQTWKQNPQLQPRFGTKPLSDKNRELIITFLLDMEAGYNVASKGRRSYIRLNNLKQRVTWIVANLGLEDVTQATERDVLLFFNRMKDGTLRRHDGKPFQSAADYIKAFAAFWHWHQRRERNRAIPDITAYLDPEAKEESQFVYFTIEQLRLVANQVKFNYKVMMWFLFDSGIRSPTELMSLRAADFQFLPDAGVYQLDIKDAYAKTFGRKIKLVLCSDLLREYLPALQPEAPFFQFEWQSFCRYVRRAFSRVLGDRMTKGGHRFSQVRPYDFRHSSACYWVVRYKQEAAFKYRFGWKENRMIHYYTRFWGMQDTITQQDVLLDSEAKTKLEKDLEVQKRANVLLEERLRKLEELIQHSALAEINARLSTPEGQAAR